MAWMKIVERHKECKSELYPDTQETQPMPDSSISKTQSSRAKSDKQEALYLDRGRRHTVWTPRKTSVGFTDVVMEVVKNRRSLRERQQTLRNRVMATQHVLKVQREVITNEDEEESGRTQQSTAEKPKQWGKVITKVIEENAKMKKTPSKMRTHFHDIVSQYMEATSKSDGDDTPSTTTQAKVAALKSLQHWKNQLMEVPQRKRMQEMSTESSIQTPVIVHHESSDAPPVSEENEM